MRNKRNDSNQPAMARWLYFKPNKRHSGNRVNSIDQDNADLLWIHGECSQNLRLPFACQPLFTRDGNVHGQELLYRGLQPASWSEVDAAVLQFLGQRDLEIPRVFVNLANESLLAIPDSAFIIASHVNRAVFELSEQYFAGDSVATVVTKVDRLLGQGVRFAIDDFGAGFDGLRRLYSMGEISYVKVDGAFLRTCMERSDASAVLAYLVKAWQQRGITVAAEWVESPSLLAYARKLDFDLTQGWYADQIYRAQDQTLRIA